MIDKVIPFPPPPTGIGIEGTGSYLTVTPPPAVDRSGRPVLIALLVLTTTLMTEYRIRIGVSATLPELASYLAIAAGFYVRPYAGVSNETRRLWVAFLTLTTLMLARALFLKTHWMNDIESPFSHVRDAIAPLLIVMLLQTRVRLGQEALLILQWTLVGAAVLASLIGISQFIWSWPFFFDGSEFTQYKTQIARGYWLAEIFHLEINSIARGLYGYSIGYATSLVVPCMVAFALVLRGSRTQRILAAMAAVLIYSAIYISFSRSVVTVLPFGCFLVVRAMDGKLSRWTCVAVVLGYLFIAFVGPLLHLAAVEDADLGTLTDRADTLMGYLRQVHRDPTVLWFGCPHYVWGQYEFLAPHNWIVFALLTNGVPTTIALVGLWIGLFAFYYPIGRTESGLLLRPTPLQAGLWCGAFVLLMVIGETEPFSGISQFLITGTSLGILAVSQREQLRVKRLREAP